MTRPKPLLLLTYLAFESYTLRRHLERLFFSDAKDPSDSLTTALRYIRKHSLTALDILPTVVGTRIKCDALLLLEDIEDKRVEMVTSRYRGPFLATLDLKLGEELEDWVYTNQDHIAQRVREVLLEQAEMQNGGHQSIKLVEKAWRLTKDQVVDAKTLDRFYQLLIAGHSSLAHDVRRFANEYCIPLSLRSFSSKNVDPLLHPSVPAARVLPEYVATLLPELEELRLSSRGLVICLWGEPGIGKSWALEHIGRLLSFATYPLTATLPAHLAPRFLPRAAALPSWARTILANLANGKPVTPQDAATAIGTLLAANAPVALHVEDLHEANEERLLFWRYLAQSIQRSPGVGLIATSRHAPPDEFCAKRLHPLTYEEVGSVLMAEAKSRLPSEVIRWIQDHTVGNPLFALEFYRYLRRQGNLWHDDHNWHWREPRESHPPGNVETLIFESLLGLPLSDVDRTVMELKALLPATTSLSVLSQAAGLNPQVAQMAEDNLMKHGILRGQKFLHPLYRETLVRALTPDRRQHLAKRIVMALQESDPTTIAPLIADAGLPESTAKTLLVLAADAAAAQGRIGQAGAILAEAIEYAEGDKNALRLQAAEYLKNVNTPRACQLVEQVLAATPDDLNATLLLAQCLVLMGDGQRAQAMLKRVHLPAVAQQQGFELLVQLRTERNDYQGAVALWEESPLRQAAAQPASKRDAAFALLNLGKFTEAETLLESALSQPGLRPEDQASLLETQALHAYYAGNLKKSLRLFDMSVSCTRNITTSDTAPRLMHVLRLRATVYWGFFRQSEAIRDLEESMSLATSLGSGRDYAIAQAYLGIPLIELGEYERAENALLESREVLRRADAREHLTACEAILGSVYLNWQHPDMAPQALRHTREALRISKELGAPVLDTQASLYAAWAELIAGDAELAFTYASHALVVAQTIGQHRVASLCHWMRGLVLERLGKLQEAVADLDQAIALAITMDLEGHELLFLVERDRLRDEPDAVQQHLTRLKPYNVSGYKFLARQLYIEEHGLTY